MESECLIRKTSSRKLWLEKETFTAQLISEFHKSFSLIRFNQMSWNMNKKHNGKKHEIDVEYILTAVQ